MAGTNNLHPLKLDELKGKPPSEVAALLEADLERGLEPKEKRTAASEARLPRSVPRPGSELVSSQTRGLRATVSSLVRVCPSSTVSRRSSSQRLPW